MNRLSLHSKNMKFKTVIQMSTLAVVLSLTVTGCRKGLEKTTPLPGRGVAAVSDSGPMGPITPVSTGPGTPITPGNDTTGIKPPDEGPKPVAVTTPPPDLSKPTALNGKLSDYVVSADQPFKGETVYFEFDKASVRPGELSKVERVAGGIKGLAGKALRIEGHCDERGTEEYNRSLGERRALAVREALMRAGVDANIIDTISYGEDRPAESGHNQEAWAKNRRGEFVVIEPPTAATSK